MQKCIDNDIVLRLKRIEGQVRGIIRMVEEGQPCEKTIIQIGAAKAALRKTGQTIIERHIHHCVADGLKNGEAQETIDKLISAMEQFAKII